MTAYRHRLLDAIALHVDKAALQNMDLCHFNLRHGNFSGFCRRLADSIG